MNRYRLKTADATYELELTRGAYAVLRDVSRRRASDRAAASGQTPIVREQRARPETQVTASAPRIGDAPLFEVPTDEWNGRELVVGALATGPLVDVERG